jgi:predicted PurR-regulated permease PerM
LVYSNKISSFYTYNKNLLFDKFKYIIILSTFSNYVNEYNYLNHDVLKSLMKYLSLLLLSVLFIPIVQVAHAQNIVEQIGQAFNNLTSGMMGGNQTSGNGNASSSNSGNQTSGNGNASSSNSGNQTSGNGNASSSNSGNQTSQDVGSIQELKNLTSGNQEMLANNTSLSGGNTSLGQGLEEEQYVEPENQSNALASVNNTQ